MLETLANAAGYLFTLPASESREIISQITEFVTIIAEVCASEAPDIIIKADRLINSLSGHTDDIGRSLIEKDFEDFSERVEGLPVQYKAVFLPYYDNTWDALKSVYEAFDADPMFQTEIVIIPVRRNTTTGSAHVYKDYLTPAGVPNTPYLEYDFEEDQPDFVFYSNPYDGVNYPQFQSHNIKPHVGCMIYVPYHIYGHVEITPKEISNAINIGTQLPGHDSCDLFVVQSEVFYKRFAKKSRNGKKMVVLGNPKTDYLQSHKISREFPRYPQWEEKIGDKKVFMINTHYSLFLQDDIYTQYWVEEIFKVVSKKDAVFIWRPHPQTFIVMEPNTPRAAFFERCVNIVSNADNIIFDTSPSAISAFLYSDALISSMSSIMFEAISLDMPVFALHVDNKLSAIINKFDNAKDLANSQYLLQYINEANTRTDCEYLLHVVDSWNYRENIPVEYQVDYTDSRLLHYAYIKPIDNFISNIIAGNDEFKEKRGKYRERLLANNGCASEAILEYVKNNLVEDK